MRILSIGNSFSQDAHRYLRSLFELNGVPCKAVNLYIGGCPLRAHYLNMLDDAPKYSLEYCGETTGFNVSIREALASDEWDVVTLQQQSSGSAYYSTFMPYLDELAEYVRTYNPQAKLYLHQTWAYEDGSSMLGRTGWESESVMFDHIRESYAKGAADIEAAGIIPCGEAMLYAHKNGIEKVHRDDGFHAGVTAGRLTLSLTWYGKLTGKSVMDAAIPKLDGDITENEIAVIRKAAAYALEH